jgi:hypothetical protein
MCGLYIIICSINVRFYAMKLWFIVVIKDEYKAVKTISDEVLVKSDMSLELCTNPNWIEFGIFCTMFKYLIISHCYLLTFWQNLVTSITVSIWNGYWTLKEWKRGYMWCNMDLISIFWTLKIKTRLYGVLYWFDTNLLDSGKKRDNIDEIKKPQVVIFYVNWNQSKCIPFGLVIHFNITLSSSYFHKYIKSKSIQIPQYTSVIYLYTTW